jgi:hypothetical protein
MKTYSLLFYLKSLKFMKINKNQQKSTKINKNLFFADFTTYWM